MFLLRTMFYIFSVISYYLPLDETRKDHIQICLKLGGEHGVYRSFVYQ